MNNPMEFFRKGAEKRKADSLNGKSMYEPGGERPLTEADARLEKMQMLNDMGLMGNQNFFPNAGPKRPFDPDTRIAPGAAIPPPEKLPPVDQYGRPLQGRSMVRQGMMKKLGGM